MSNPSIPGIDLAEVRAKADAEKSQREALQQAREQAAMADAERYVHAWHRNMARVFKGISGGSSLHRRFNQRAAGARHERTGSVVGSFKGMGG